MTTFRTPKNKIKQKKNENSRYVPYFNTPRRRSIKKDYEKKGGSLGLTNRVWQTYATTYLNKFNCNKDSLMDYSKLLTIFLQSHYLRGANSRKFDQSSFKAEFSVVHNEKSSTTSLMIDVTGSSLSLRKRSKNSSTAAPINFFSAILLSQECYANVDANETRSLWFPILLLSGGTTISKSVVEFLSDRFDSCIFELNFAPHELEWIVAMWPNVEDEDKKRPIELLFHHSNAELNKIKYQIDAENVEKLWGMIHFQGEDVLLEDVQLLFQQLKDHFFHLFRIDLAKLQLNSIGTPALTANTKGKLKIFSEDVVSPFLHHLTILNPMLST